MQLPEGSAHRPVASLSSTPIDKCVVGTKWAVPNVTIFNGPWATSRSMNNWESCDGLDVILVWSRLIFKGCLTGLAKNLESTFSSF